MSPDPRREAVGNGRSARRVSVVVADDTADVRALLKMSLELDGRFEVVAEADDGAKAVTAIANHQPDAVVLDLAMPAMDGLQAIPEIRRRSPGSKIAVFSGFLPDQMAQAALDAGADRYIEKGRSVKDVPAALADLCRDRVPHPRPALSAPSSPPATAGADADPEDRVLELVSCLAHELQTPVTVILGFAATLQRAVTVMRPEQIVAASEAIVRHADNLAGLVQGFSDAGAVDGGTLHMRTERTDLAAWVRQTVADLEPMTEPHPVIVEVADAVSVPIDRLRVREVLTNLLSNAAKFSDGDTPITVRVARAGPGVTVAVTDNGPGVPVERERELFTKFGRLGHSGKGSGLGLFISRGIARAHGGDLVFERPSHGGARFVLQLPEPEAVRAG